MDTHTKTRIEIVVELPVLNRLLEVLDGTGVSGYTVVPAVAGRGTQGRWQRDGLVGEAGQMMLVFCILDPSMVDDVLQRVFELVERHIGIVSTGDVKVVRPARF